MGIQHKWTVDEVRNRLENYSLDDSLYDVQAVRLSWCKVGHSSADDPMINKGYRLLKRSQLDQAMQRIGRVLYYYIRFHYIHGEPVEVIATISGRSPDAVTQCIKEGVYYITKELNKQQKRNPLTA